MNPIVAATDSRLQPAALTRAIKSGFVWGAITLAAVVSVPEVSLADEGGVSFWLPGLYGSFASVPQAAPGWSLFTFSYYTNVRAGADVSAAREIQIGRFTPTATANLSASLKAQVGLEWVQPNYAFATPVLGGQLMLSLGEFVGSQTANLAGTLTATLPPFTLMRSDSISSTVTGFSDMYPVAALRWHDGVNNYLIYGTGDVPVGAYNSTRLANLGIGHGAVDGGAGYTYLNPQTGHEFTAVAGLTYNLMNTSTNYQNGVDFHLDWGASQFLSKQLFVGPVGYFYDQLSCDSGSGDRVGCFKSRVIGVGPQVGYIFPIAGMQGYLNLKAYGEFDGSDRPTGWNAWLTFSISPSAPTPTSRGPLVYK